MVFEGILDVGGVPRLRLGFVNVVEQIDGEVAEASLVKGLRERLTNEGPGLSAVHRSVTLFSLLFKNE